MKNPFLTLLQDGKLLRATQGNFLDITFLTYYINNRIKAQAPQNFQNLHQNFHQKYSFQSMQKT